MKKIIGILLISISPPLCFAGMIWTISGDRFIHIFAWAVVWYGAAIATGGLVGLGYKLTQDK